MLRCPLFPDIPPALRKWHEVGVRIVIYSSGSVAAQKLLFQYTDAQPQPDLRPLIEAYFDTVNAGPKQERESYVKIAVERDVEVGKWLFLSDNVAEVEAAKEAGMQSLVVVREGNAALTVEERARNAVVESFGEIRIKRV